MAINKIVNEEAKGLAVFRREQLAVRRRVGEGDVVGAQVAAVHEGAPERESRVIRAIGALQPAGRFHRRCVPPPQPASATLLLILPSLRFQTGEDRCEMLVSDSGVIRDQEAF